MVSTSYGCAQTRARVIPALSDEDYFDQAEATSVVTGAVVDKVFRRIHKAGHYGILVQILEPLPLEVVRVEFDGMIFLLPELVLGVVGIAAAFLLVFLNGAEQGFGRVPLQVAQDAGEVIGLAADEVGVVGHEAPSVDF